MNLAKGLLSRIGRTSAPKAHVSTLILSRHGRGVKGHRLPFRLDQREQVQGDADEQQGFRFNCRSRLLIFLSRLLNGLS